MTMTMPAERQRDYDWQRRFSPQIKRILGELLIKEGRPEDDMRRNTDFMVMELGTVRVACRVRRYKDYARYGGQFTIRSWRPSGVETELHKVIRGWGDYIFYAFAAADESRLAAWLLGDLAVFRFWHSQQLGLQRRPWVSKDNPDGSSSFQAYEIADLPPEFIIRRHPGTLPVPPLP